MSATQNQHRVLELRRRIDGLRHIIESTQRDDLRHVLLEMLHDAERALAALDQRHQKAR